MNHPLSKPKYLSLTATQQHKLAAKLLREKNLSTYRNIEEWLQLNPLSDSFESQSNRYHYHIEQAGLSLKEHQFLPKVTTQDSPSSVPYLPVHIYLDSLRSAFNVGSIMRTTEALRLGTLYFSEKTPLPSHKQVQDAAMGAEPPTKQKNLSTLPKPIIAIETVENATPLPSFTFPKCFTLILGNEEFGISEKNLAQADAFISIPLCGEKNSLNVANAFAIVAYEIRKQRGMHA